MKVGDTVKLKPAMWQGIKPESYGLSFTEEYEVTEYFNNPVFSSIKIKGHTQVWDKNAFQVVVKEEEKYVYKGWNLPVKYKNESELSTDELKILHLFKQIADDLEEDKLKKESIERPVLKERKKDKIRMELFDEGFPNAILEVAKVMTWASENKGYKDHDWVNLPDADSAFSAAASRHKLKGIIQKLNGVEALQRTDEESNILHKAHEVFNGLAELELMLRGVIK